MQHEGTFDNTRSIIQRLKAARKDVFSKKPPEADQINFKELFQ